MALQPSSSSDQMGGVGHKIVLLGSSIVITFSIFFVMQPVGKFENTLFIFGGLGTAAWAVTRCEYTREQS
jgi:hypothetical protein